VGSVDCADPLALARRTLGDIGFDRQGISARLLVGRAAFVTDAQARGWRSTAAHSLERVQVRPCI
jgi:hypothetical protein